MNHEELKDFYESRRDRLSMYNRIIQERRKCDDQRMADCFLVDKESYGKNWKYWPPKDNVLKYVNLHYELNICLDRYLADDSNYDLFEENNRNSGIVVPRRDAFTEFKEIVQYCDYSMSREEKYSAAIYFSDIWPRWLNKDSQQNN